MILIKQNPHSVCKILYKQPYKTLKNPSKGLEYVDNLDGTHHLRSSKDSELENLLDPRAKKFCEGFKKDKNNKIFFILP